MKEKYTQYRVIKEKASQMKGRVGYGVTEVKMVIKLFASDLIIIFRLP